MLHVAIVVHRHDSFNESDYLLRLISECWRDIGVRVSVISDPRVRINADLAILHINLTVVPKEYLDSVRHYAVAVNGDVSDISKRAISAHLLRREDRYEGPVIVKTDRNHKGHSEKHLARRGLVSLDYRHSAKNCVNYFKEEYRRARRWRRYGSAEAFFDYPIFDSMAEVPDAVWGDDDLVVERFLAERLNGRYCVRTWLFLGDEERHAIFYSHDPVVKSDNIIDFERLSEVPEKLRHMRRCLKFDFGKFDYTMVDGQPVLFDANHTPAMGRFSRERYLPVVHTLASGLGSLLRNP